MDIEQKIAFLKDMGRLLKKHNARIDVDLKGLEVQSLSFCNDCNPNDVFFTTYCINPGCEEFNIEKKRLENLL